MGSTVLSWVTILSQSSKNLEAASSCRTLEMSLPIPLGYFIDLYPVRHRVTTLEIRGLSWLKAPPSLPMGPVLVRFFFPPHQTVIVDLCLALTWSSGNAWTWVRWSPPPCSPSWLKACTVHVIPRWFFLERHNRHQLLLHWDSQVPSSAELWGKVNRLERFHDAWYNSGMRTISLRLSFHSSLQPFIQGVAHPDMLQALFWSLGIYT